MSLAEQVVVLGGSWVEQRKQVGRSEILICGRPLLLNKEAVRAEIGDQKPFDIYQVKNGIGTLMSALRIGRSLIVWQATAINAPNTTESHWVTARVDFCEMENKEGTVS